MFNFDLLLKAFMKFIWVFGYSLTSFKVFSSKSEISDKP